MTMICVSQIVHQRILYLRIQKFFSFLIMQGSDVNTISGSAKLIEGSGRANILLPGGTKIHIDDALYSTKSQRNLLSFKDIRRNGYHIETTNEDNTEYLYITNVVSGKKKYIGKITRFFLWFVLHKHKHN